MKPVRVKMEHVETLRFPAFCPCCLGGPAETPTLVVRAGGAVYTAWWPHCAFCARNEQRRSRSLFWSQALATIGLFALLLAAPVFFSVHPVAPWDGWAVLGMGAALPIAAIVLHTRFVSRLRKPSGAVRAGAGVRVHRAGAHLLGKGCMLEISLLQEEYGREFVRLNRDMVLKVTEG